VVIGRRPFLRVVLGMLAAPLAAEAEQAGKVYRIGFLYSGLSGASPAVLKGFRQGLGELGYVEAKDIAIEYRFDEGNLARLPDLAAELVRLNVDVIVASGGTPTSRPGTPPAQFLLSFRR
jgi:putative ABC transport system substrate-binding protein